MSGRVYLVGAGPGDPGLLTARALELIATADVILHDRLIPAEALDGARADAELLFVGKEGGGASVPQEQTFALMLDRARAGLRVVRLKGGDPFVFGRGGEEALALREAAGGGRGRGGAAARGARGRPGRGAAGAACMAGARAAQRAHRRGHTRACAGELAIGAPARARGARRGGARDQHAPAARAGAR